jgi:hypothetical protein
MKSPVTKTKYSRRLEMFFDFLKIPGETIEEQCLTFVNNGRNNINWVFTNILKFVYYLCIHIFIITILIYPRVKIGIMLHKKCIFQFDRYIKRGREMERLNLFDYWRKYSLFKRGATNNKLWSSFLILTNNSNDYNHNTSNNNNNNSSILLVDDENDILNLFYEFDYPIF